MMRIVTIISLPALLVVAAAMLASCGHPGTGKVGKIIVACSGDTAGWITPCGCTVSQSGGLPRRATRLRQLAAEGTVLYVDVGGASGGASEYDLFKFRAILAGERAMGLVAHNLGNSEAMFGPEAIGNLAANAGIPFISANLVTAEGKAIAPPIILTGAGDAKLAVVGVISRQFSDPRWSVRDPRVSALAALESAKGRYSGAVLLAYAPEDELQELARTLPEFDVIIGGPTGQSIAPHRVGTVLLTSATNKGKFLVEASADQSHADAWSWSANITELNDRITDDPTQKRLLDEYRSELSRRRFLPQQTGFVPQLVAAWPADYRFADPSACNQCHTTDAGICLAHRHSTAYRDLVERKADSDPYCVRCHTTAYGMPGGFASSTDTPSLLNVTCQACHGPSQAHVNNHATKPPWLAREQCRNCHDHENSPQFDYDEFWMRIKHGEVKPVMAEVRK